jgi:hypothetical protein
MSDTVQTFLIQPSLLSMKMRRRIAKNLEDKANELAARHRNTRWDNSIPGMIGREIALTLDQLEQVKFLSRDQARRLLQQECAINTEIKEFHQSIPWYTSGRFPEEQKLKQRLFDIEKERRMLDQQYHEKRRNLEDRLLSLLNKHQQLDIEP